MKNTVVTSINPFGNLSHQLRCFKSWQEAGYQVVSFNAPVEADALLVNGVPRDAVHQLYPEDTTYSENGKYQPKIRAILNVVSEWNSDVLIVNGDILPCHGIPLWSVLGNIGPCLGLTRREYIAGTIPNIQDDVYYEGGLDAFYLRADKARGLARRLDCSGLDSLAFGSPGWDYIVGATIVRRLGGHILHGPIIAHEVHPTTYAGLESLRPALPELNKLLGDEAATLEASVETFADEIVALCRKNLDMSRRLNLFYNAKFFENTAGPKSSDSLPADLRKVINTRQASTAECAIDYVIATNDWQGIARQLGHICTLVSDLCFRCRILELVLAGKEIESPLATDLPPNQLVTVEIEQRARRASCAEEFTISLFDIFAQLTMKHKIFDIRLYDFLIWSCKCVDEVAALARIRKLALNERNLGC